MVRPEPDQTFEETDVGVERSVVMGLSFGKINLLRNTGALLLHRLGVAIHVIGAAVHLSAPHAPLCVPSENGSLRAAPRRW